MNREQRILNHNKRDVTRIVSRKPSNSEGNNGDFAVGNTAQGPMLFSKANNRWYSLEPKTVPARQDATFKGSLHMKSSGIHKYNTGVSDYFSWLQLGAWSTYSLSGNFFSHNFERSFEVAYPGTSSEEEWTDQITHPFLLPYDTTIEGFFGRPSEFPDGVAFEAIKYTVEVFSLEEGKSDWDTGSSNDYIRTGGSASSSVERVTANFLENAKMYEFKMNNTYVYPKGSYIAMAINTNKEDDSNGDFVSAYFQLHLKYHE